MNMWVCLSFQISFYFLWILRSVIGGSILKFFKNLHMVFHSGLYQYILSMHEFSLLSTSSQLLFFLMKVILTEVMWYLTVVAFTLPWWSMKLTQYLFVFCWPSLSSLDKYIFRLSTHIENQIFLLFICINLYILDINPLSAIWFAKIFSHWVGCLFILLVSLAVWKILFDVVSFVYFSVPWLGCFLTVLWFKVYIPAFNLFWVTFVCGTRQWSIFLNITYWGDFLLLFV